MYSNGDLEFIAQFGHTHEEKKLAKQFLLERTEREKNPGVWDGAPENARVANVRYATDGGVGWDIPGSENHYTRTLPKTKAREIAERKAREWANGSKSSAYVDGLSEHIESAINEALDGGGK